MTPLPHLPPFIFNFSSLNSRTSSPKCELPDDTLYFAYCYPYTYTDLQRDLSPARFPSDPQYRLDKYGGGSSILRRGILCESLGGNPVPMLTITDFSNSTSSENSIEKSSKGTGTSTGSSTSNTSETSSDQLANTTQEQYHPTINLRGLKILRSIRKRKYIVLSGRVHPGESNAR